MFVVVSFCFSCLLSSVLFGVLLLRSSFLFLVFSFCCCFFLLQVGSQNRFQINKNRPKILPKSSQNRPKILPKSSPEGGPARNLKNHRFFLPFFRLLGASWAVWAASWGLRRPKLEAKTEQKSIKNRSQNSCKFKGHLNLDFRRILVDFWSQNGAKLGSKSDQKRSLC